MLFFVYGIYNKINGKIYIGKTKNFKLRISTHIRIAKSDSKIYGKFAIHNAIRKYGEDNFLYKILDTVKSEEIAFDREKQWIKLLTELNYILYNLTDGGEGIVGLKFSEEHKRKLSESHMGQVAWNKGLELSESHRKILSLAHIGKTPPNKGIPMSEEQKLKVAKNNGGSKLIPLQILEIRQLLKTDMTLKEIGIMYGVSKETIRRIKHNLMYRWVEDPTFSPNQES